jgi:hypothetical protein
MKRFAWMFLVWVALSNGHILRFPEAQGWLYYDDPKGDYLILYSVTQAEAEKMSRKVDTDLTVQSQEALRDKRVAVFRLKQLAGYGTTDYEKGK